MEWVDGQLGREQLRRSVVSCKSPACRQDALVSTSYPSAVSRFSRLFRMGAVHSSTACRPASIVHGTERLNLVDKRLHMLHLSSEQRRFALGRRATVVVVIVLCVVIYVLRTSDANAVDGEDVLLVLPLALLALQFGLAGGIAGALIAVALIGLWDLQDKDIGLNVEGYLSWGLTFVLLGVLLGAFVDHRRRLEAVLAHYFDGSLDLLATVNLDGWFTRVNPAWERTLGYSAETLCSRPLIEFVHPEDRASTLAENDAVTDGSRDIVGFRNRYRAADGSYRWLEWSGHTTLSDGLINAVARDVTVQHEAEEQLARHAEMLESKVAERTQELEDARAKTLRRLALAAEYRDDDTFEHTTRVGSMSAEIGALLGPGRIRSILCVWLRSCMT